MIMAEAENRRRREHSRSTERLSAHYRVEKDLANKLRTATKDERKGLYPLLYDELYRKVPDHPQIVRKTSPADSEAAVIRQMRLIRRFLNPETTFLEVGAGDCALAFRVAEIVSSVYAVDVSEMITNASRIPENFTLALSDGCSIPVTGNSIDVAYSYQLMEHLHPDDAYEQLVNIYACLKPGGRYICETPSRLNGPHDISSFFDSVASGFHLKEYTFGELEDLFHQAGFSSISPYVGIKGRYFGVPQEIVRTTETTIEFFQRNFQRWISKRLPCRLLLGVPIVATK